MKITSRIHEDENPWRSPAPTENVLDSRVNTSTGLISVNMSLSVLCSSRSILYPAAPQETQTDKSDKKVVDSCSTNLLKKQLHFGYRLECASLCHYCINARIFGNADSMCGDDTFCPGLLSSIWLLCTTETNVIKFQNKSHDKCECLCSSTSLLGTRNSEW